MRNSPKLQVAGSCSTYLLQTGFALLRANVHGSCVALQLAVIFGDSALTLEPTCRIGIKKCLQTGGRKAVSVHKYNSSTATATLKPIVCAGRRMLHTLSNVACARSDLYAAEQEICVSHQAFEAIRVIQIQFVIYASNFTLIPRLKWHTSARLR